MITNREEVIDKAFKVFLQMNYEKASINTLAQACGLTKTGVVYYFPHKQELFMAVADKYVLQLHNPANKFATPADTLAEFLQQYVEVVAQTMKRVVELVGKSNCPTNCAPNFYYFHFISQVRMYYPNVRQKLEEMFKKDRDMWTKVIRHAKESGEIRSDTDVPKAVALFRQMFYGLSYEQAFLNGLDTKKLAEYFQYIYSLLKA